MIYCYEGFLVRSVFGTEGLGIEGFWYGGSLGTFVWRDFSIGYFWYGGFLVKRVHGTEGLWYGGFLVRRVFG